jgi:hypothetical protein
MRSLLIKSFGRYWADFDKTFLMPNVLHLSLNSNNHVGPLTPDRESIKEMLIFRLLTSNNRSIIGKLQSMDWIKKLEGETELTVLFSSDMLNICVETHIK